MLADLEFVSNAADGYAVKPADLPSMRGQGAAQAVQVQMVNATGMSDAAAFESLKAGQARAVGVAVPDGGEEGEFRGFGIAAGLGGPAGAFAQVGELHLDAEGNPLPRTPSTKPSTQRPKLRVTNWWTGEYALAEPIEGLAAAGLAGAGAVRAEARHVAAEVRRAGPPARMKAREQVAAARQRAAELRARAKAARHRSIAERQPSLALIGVTASVLLVGGLAVAAIVAMGRSRSLPSLDGSPQVAALVDPEWLGPRLRERIATIRTTENTDRTVFVMDGVQPFHDPSSTRWVHRVVADAVDEGTTITSDSDTAARVRPLLARLNAGVEASISELDQILAEKKCSMLVVYTAKQGEPFLIYPAVPCVPTPPSPPDSPAPLAGTTLMVVNDHPSSGDVAVAERVESLRQHCASQGYEIVIPDPQVEAEIRVALATWRIGGDETSRRELEQQLAAHGIGGLLHITARPGSAAPADRTEWVVLQVPPGDLCDPHEDQTEEAQDMEELSQPVAEE
jgi:hypothetical protein